jgi:hypothetical protein
MALTSVAVFGPLLVASLPVLQRRRPAFAASGPVFHVAIAGYDPRDVLQGHYLRYRLQWPGDGACDTPPCCLCLRTAGVHTTVACSVTDAACDAQLSREMIEQEREFFIQEDAGLALEQALRRGQGSIALNVTPHGQVQVHALLIEGVPHRRWRRDSAQRQ